MKLSETCPAPLLLLSLLTLYLVHFADHHHLPRNTRSVRQSAGYDTLLYGQSDSDELASHLLVDDNTLSMSRQGDFTYPGPTADASSLAQPPSSLRNKPLPPAPTGLLTTRSDRGSHSLTGKPSNMKIVSRLRRGRSPAKQPLVPAIQTELDSADPKITALPRAQSHFNLTRFLRPAVSRDRSSTHSDNDESSTKSQRHLQEASDARARVLKRSPSETPRSRNVLNKVKDAVSDRLPNISFGSHRRGRRRTMVGPSQLALGRLADKRSRLDIDAQRHFAEQRNLHSPKVQKVFDSSPERSMSHGNLYSPKLQRVLGGQPTELTIFDNESRRSLMRSNKRGTEVDASDVDTSSISAGTQDADVFITEDLPIHLTAQSFTSLKFTVPSQPPSPLMHRNTFSLSAEASTQSTAHNQPLVVTCDRNQDYKGAESHIPFSNERDPLRQHTDVMSFVFAPDDLRSTQAQSASKLPEPSNKSVTSAFIRLSAIDSPPDGESTPRKLFIQPSKRNAMGLAQSPLRRTRGHSDCSSTDTHWEFVPGQATLLNGRPYTEDGGRQEFENPDGEGASLNRPFSVPEFSFQSASDDSSYKRKSTADANMLLSEHPLKRSRTSEEGQITQTLNRSSIDCFSLGISPEEDSSFTAYRREMSIDDDLTITGHDPTIEEDHMSAAHDTGSFDIDDEDVKPLIAVAVAFKHPTRPRRYLSMPLVPTLPTYRKGKKRASKEMEGSVDEAFQPGHLSQRSKGSVDALALEENSPLQHSEGASLNKPSEEEQPAPGSVANTDELQMSDEDYVIGVIH